MKLRIFSMKRFIALSLFLLIFITGCNSASGGKYTENKLVKKCGFDEYDSMEINLRGIDCTYIEGIGLDANSPYNGVKFYIFDSSSDAKEVFDTDVNDCVQYFIIEDQNESDISYWGIESGVLKLRYEYVSGNLLLKTSFNNAYSFSDVNNDEDGKITREIEDRIDSIKNEFTDNK